MVEEQVEFENLSYNGSVSKKKKYFFQARQMCVVPFPHFRNAFIKAKANVQFLPFSHSNYYIKNIFSSFFLIFLHQIQIGKCSHMPLTLRFYFPMACHHLYCTRSMATCEAMKQEIVDQSYMILMTSLRKIPLVSLL